MVEFLSGSAFVALVQVILIDLVLAGDNAIVIGLAAASLPREQRGKAILVGVAAATALRILFAGIATWLLALVGLLLAGGFLLLWVCWKMWRELRPSSPNHNAANGSLSGDYSLADHGPTATPKTFAQAAWQIVIADVSMSLDNVLAVAGAAREHPFVLIFGLGLSVALMGIAASLIARLLNRYRWIAYVGLAIILYVALHMIVEGTYEIHEAVAFGQLLPWPLWAAFRPDLLAELFAGNAGPATELAEAPIFRRIHSTAAG